MGIYLNPNNDRFLQALTSEIYVDKSGMIAETNRKIMTNDKYICVTRPSGFGKTINLNMLSAYYSRGCDSREIFDNLSISKDKSYMKYLNQLDVLYLNMQELLNTCNNIEEFLCLIEQLVMNELEEGDLRIVCNLHERLLICPC